MAANKDKLIAAAQKLVEKGQFDKAIKEYLKVVQTDDKDVRIWLKIGDLYAKLGKKPEATETYSKVAEFYSEQGFYLKSVAVYKQILKLDPRLVDVNHRLAELYKQLGLLSDAMQQYEAVAAFYHREGKTREALAALKQIVELDPETVANRIKLAELYSKESMAREAIDEFTKAAEQLKEQGRTDDYMKVAERLLFHSPDNRPVSKELARMYIDKGDPRRALPKLQVCFKADPRDTEVLSLLAKAFEALDQRQKSVSVLKELARILGENGDRQARDEVYRKILVLQPGDPDAEAALGAPGPVAAVAAAAAKKPAPPIEPLRVSGGFPQLNETGGARPLTSQSFPSPPIEDEIEEPSARSLDDPGDVAKPQPQTALGQILDKEPQPEASADSEEIARILNETDVYIKYKLYAKAIEHVQRVFEYEPRHLEAREKLKALYLTVGKKEEAILELWALAQQAESGKQRRFLREILELDPSHEKAAAMLGEKPQPKAAAAEAKRGAAADDELLDVEDLEELDDGDFEVAEPSRVGPDVSEIEDANTFDGDDKVPRFGDEAREGDDDLIPLVVDQAHDKPDEGEDAVEDRFGFGDEEPAEEDRFSLPAAEDEAEAELEAVPVTDLKRTAPNLQRGFEDDEPSSTDAQSRPPAEPSEDHDARTRFDDRAAKMLAQEGLFGGDVDESELPAVEDLPSEERAALGGKQGTATVPQAALPKSLQSTAVTAPDDRNDGSLEDDLDEADFFIQQSLFDEARGILQSLLARHPGHPLVGAKLRDLDAMQGAAAGSSAPVEVEPPPPEMVAAPEQMSEPQQVIESDISAELPDEQPSTAHSVDDDEREPVVDEPAIELTKKGVIEKGVTAEDFETHYDLGIAYKEMGLLDDAITEFKLVMKDPQREVQCHLMIGLCCLEKGLQTEAIGYFKKGLYVEGITERESLSLYFELGQAYEKLGDPREALYYYEKVLKRDARFRNVERIVEHLRSGGSGAQSAPAATPGGDDVDAAFDGILGGDN